MQIQLNGEPYTLDAPVNVLVLAKQLQLNPTQVAIERNCAIVPRSMYEQVMLDEGDAIEIVQFIGGG